jgi:uncharacterized protein YeaC (DUF1315 family)
VRIELSKWPEGVPLQCHATRAVIVWDLARLDRLQLQLYTKAHAVMYNASFSHYPLQSGSDTPMCMILHL